LESGLTDAGVPLHILGKQSRWGVVGFLWRLARLVRSSCPAILHSYLGTANILAVLMKPFSPRMKVVWGVRASNMELGHYGWLDRVLYWMECRLSRFADLIIVNSHAGREYAVAQGFPRKTMVMIPNGIDTQRFCQDGAARARVRGEWGVADQECVIGLVGRLDPMKGHQTFLQAAMLLARERSDVRFVCVGDGPSSYRETLRMLAEQRGLDKRILWVPASDSMPAVYNALDLLTSSSTFGEGFSNVIGEAMACGTPCVVSDVGDASMIVGETGLVVPPRDPEALCKAWCEALAWTAEECASRGRQARERIAQQFSVDRMVKATLKELELVAGRSLAMTGR
jgi:glycosyltransferase involved in cell wall biosynthesis